MLDAPCIVAAHDGRSRCGVRYAADLAAVLGEDLIIAEVYRHDPAHEGQTEHRFDAATAALELAEHSVPGAVHAEAIALPGGDDTAEALLALARQRHATAIVLGSDAHGHVTRDVLTHADCPVVIAPIDALLLPHGLRRIGVALDGSVGSTHALVAATELARRSGAELELIAVARQPRNTAGLERMLAAHARELPGLTVHTQVLDGRAGQQLRRASERLDLICTGARGRPGVFGRPLGSVSSQLASFPTCPVLITPPRVRTRPQEPLGLTRANA